MFKWRTSTKTNFFPTWRLFARWKCETNAGVEVWQPFVLFNPRLPTASIWTQYFHHLFIMITWIWSFSFCLNFQKRIRFDDCNIADFSKFRFEIETMRSFMRLCEGNRQGLSHSHWIYARRNFLSLCFHSQCLYAFCLWAKNRLSLRIRAQLSKISSNFWQFL